MIFFRTLFGEPTLNGEPVPADGVAVGEGLHLEGEKQCQIENQHDHAITMTVGDPSDGGTQHEIPAGATVTVTGPLPVKLEAAHAG